MDSIIRFIGCDGFFSCFHGRIDGDLNNIIMLRLNRFGG